MIAFEPRSHRQAGGALLVSLAFVVLVTIAILAYFAHTQSAFLSSRTVVTRLESENLVNSAIEATLSDLRLEMLAGAERNASRTNFDSLEPMVVWRRWAMVPSRVVSSNLPAAGFENLVKQSLSGQAFYPGSTAATNYVSNGPAAAVGRRRAAAVNTAQPSADGRILSPARWGQAALTTASFPTNALPDWIYVTRAGVPADGSALSAADAGNPDAANTNHVIGRFAYQIYDVGGLLNLNVAGHPALQSTNAPRKGGLPWADLTALGLSSDQVAEIMNFRHAATQSDSGLPDRWRFESERRGFLTPLKASSATDGFFYSRQDLLRFLLRVFRKTKLSECTDQERGVLASVVHDLRFLSAPSWNPPVLGSAERPAIKAATQGGNNSQGLDDLFNPVITTNTVLPGKEFTRLRYDDPETYSSPREVDAKAGEPMLTSRFPLSRLRLITRDAVADKSSAIYRYFGLTRSSPDEPWVYNHGTSSPLRVLRLVEVRTGQNTDGQLPREPDFVELLKVAIAAGSLGKSAGIHNSGSDWANARDQRVNYQLVQIFANLIDQFDEDGFPTHLQFDGMDFYGVESLPYLQRVKVFMARLLADGDPAVDGNGRPLPWQPFSLVWIPEVWNPHDSNQPLPADRPTKFRVVADSLGVSYPIQYRDAEQGTDKTYFNPDGIKAEFDPEKNHIELTDKAVAQSGEPVMLSRPDLGKPSIRLDQINRTPPDGSESPDWSTRAAVDSDLSGIASPAIFVGLDVTFIGLRYYTNDTIPGVTFAMEYQDPATGGWHRYLERPVLRAGPNIGTAAPRGKSKSDSDYEMQNNVRFMAFDPRTDRFSSYRLHERGDQANSYKDGLSLRPNQNAGYGMSFDPSDGTRQSPGRDSAYGWTMGAANPTTKSTNLNGTATRGLAMGTVLQNNGTGTYYTDPDGILRSGDGVLAGGSDKEGQMYWPGNHPSRPIILNRPFRSVAEMGYAFRDTPGRSLDFFTQKSGDANLLDFFSIDETPDDGLTSARVSANTRNAKVVESLLRGAERDPVTGATLLQSRAEAAAQAYVAHAADPARGPFLNRSELATRFLAGLPVPAIDKSERIKRQREVFVRALADSMETRTWNFLIDLIAQTGRVPRGKTALADFRVESERHVWVHLAVDRITGKVLQLNIEPVRE